jgi:hypothetical protein
MDCPMNLQEDAGSLDASGHQLFGPAIIVTNAKSLRQFTVWLFFSLPFYTMCSYAD